MREQYELRQNVTDEVKLSMVYNCVMIAKTLKGMFPVIWEHELDRDSRYMKAEMEIAMNALCVMNSLVGDTDDEAVNEARAYLTMLLETYSEGES